MVGATHLSVWTLAQALAAAIGETIVDVRYHRGLWGVMVPVGNIMVKVPGSFHNTPEEALSYCLQRWAERSPARPFLFGEPEREA